MNKTLILASLILIMFTLTACGTIAQAASADQPATIQDPLLQEAWTHLNDHTEPVNLWDGQTISGHDLAQYVLVNAIPIVWDVEDICKGNSCSVLYKKDGIWQYEDDKPGIEPIYITPSIRNLVNKRMELIIETMAHEIYHRMQPYGMEKDSLYEEFSAYYISTHISGATWTNIEAYDPRKPGCLTRWFIDRNLMYGYEGMDLYPSTVAVSIDISDQNCPLAGEAVNSVDAQNTPILQTAHDYILDCQANSLGLIVCERTETKDTPLVPAPTNTP